jgi:hypothetical protein
MEGECADERTWGTRRPDVEGKDCDNCMFMAMIDSSRRHKSYNARMLQQ